MKKLFAVARWEYMEKIKSKAFLFSLFLTPIIMVAVSVIPALLASQADTESKTIGIIDLSGQVVSPLSKLLEERFKLPTGAPNYLLRSFTIDTSKNAQTVARHEADSLALAEMIEGYLIIGKNFMGDSSFEYRSPNVGNVKLMENLRSVLQDFLLSQRLIARGLDPHLAKDLSGTVDLKTIKLSKSGEQESGFSQVFFTAYIFMMMMFILIMTSGQLLVRSMLEEKSNRVVEILLSSCSANDLMGGKIIGLSGLGITQLLFWVLIGFVITVKLSIALLSLPLMLLILLYIILGYLLYAAIFIAIGSPVSTEQEAQQITSYLVMILIVPIALAFSVAQSPNSTLVRVLSYIPLFSPSFMIMRIPNQLPSVPEIIITLLLIAASVIGMMWIAGKIFRTTILSYGKRPGLREMIALIRSA